jgi:hypothetical protein
MTTYQVNILNPKADKLLKNLADLQLISISKTSSEPFLSIVNKLRDKAAANPPTLEEINREVEIVRAERYAKNKEA